MFVCVYVCMYICINEEAFSLLDGIAMADELCHMGLKAVEIRCSTTVSLYSSVFVLLSHNTTLSCTCFPGLACMGIREIYG